MKSAAEQIIFLSILSVIESMAASSLEKMVEGALKNSSNAKLMHKSYLIQKGKYIQYEIKVKAQRCSYKICGKKKKCLKMHLLAAVQ